MRSGIDERRCTNDKCSLYTGKNNPVWDYYDPETCEILFIAEAPGADEDRLGRPLVGMAGGVLFQALHHAGLTSIGESFHSYIYTNGQNLNPIPTIGLANVVHCRPPANRTPDNKECSWCSAWLDETISSCTHLRCVVLLGDTPLRYLLGEKNITKRRGMPTLLNGIPCVPTIHPASCLPFRSPENFDLLVRDIQKAVRLAKDGWTCPEVITEDINEDIIEELERTGFAFDIETTDLSISDGHIIGIAFSNHPEKAWHAWRDNIYQWGLAVRLLETKAWKAAQGNSFDVPFLNVHGVSIDNVDFDTQYGQKLIDPDQPATLAHILSLYTDHPYYKGQRDELLAGRLTREQIKDYCGRDAAGTWTAIKPINDQLTELGLLPVFQNIIMPSSRTANRMQIKGIKIDVSKQDQLLQDINNNVLKWRNAFDKYGYNIDSPTQLMELFEKLKFKARSTDKKELDRLYKRTEHPILKCIIEYRPWCKMESMLFGKEGDSGLFNQLDKNGIIHTRFKPNGTANSRWSSSNPNLQNIPKELRYIFIPTEPTLGFMEADYTRLELYVAATLSEDETFLDHVENTPIHDNLAKEFYGNDYTEKQRRIAKTIIFGTIYGKGARSIAMEYGITVKEAEKLQYKLAGRYPKLIAYAKRNLDSLKSLGYLTSVFGRRRYFMSGNIASDAANYPIQTAAGDINNYSAILLDEAGFDLRLAVHDSCVIQYPIGEEDYYAGKMTEIMCRPIPEIHGYRFPVTIKYGRNLRDLEEYTPKP